MTGMQFCTIGLAHVTYGQHRMHTCDSYSWHHEKLLSTCREQADKTGSLAYKKAD